MEIQHVIGRGCSLSQLSIEFLAKNYDYIWLKSMLKKARTSNTYGSTLITGSSHALNGIYEPIWNNAVNCSMHSQDLYYDFCCARKVLEENHHFDKCFIVLGYYIAYQDLSRSTEWGKSIISSVYKPLFDDTHNWVDFPDVDLWTGIGDFSVSIKEQCEEMLYTVLYNKSYYNDIRNRAPFFDFQGYVWAQLSDFQKDALGKMRAESHNKSFRYKGSYEENKLILKEYVHYLYQHDVLPILVVTPFTPEYNRYVLQDMKDGLLEMVDSVPENIHYVNFNDVPELFTPADFMDTDHLSELGAKKVSEMLSEMFGK